MPTSANETYIICIRRKGHPKKHIDVCHRCRWRDGCKPYQAYRQPGLPLKHRAEKKPTAPLVSADTVKVKKTPVSPPPAIVPALTLADALDLLDMLKQGLEDIRNLCD